MLLRISTSLTLNAQTQLARTSQAIARSLERLSSGRRVSSARDDQAVFSMGIRLDSHIRGLRAGLQNINQAQGMLETASSAISSQMDIVRRMRELAVQASNGTLTSTDRENLNQELTSLFNEFKRITETTEFNGQKLLDGSLSSSLQIGPDSSDQVSFSLNNLSAATTFLKSTGSAAFNSAVSYSSGGRPNSVEIGDINGDGNLDAVSMRSSGGTIKFFIGDGNGNFAEGGTLLTGLSENDIKLEDINKDGILDLLAAETSAGTLSVYLGRGDGTFQDRTTLASGTTPLSIETGDVNGDGNVDMVVTDSGDAQVSIYLGNGDGTFQTRTTVTTGTTPTDILLRDIDNNGILDMIVSDAGAATVSLLMGNGDGTFQTRTTLGTGATPKFLEAGDVNGDGYLDLFVADTAVAAKTISFYLNNGDGTFGVRQTISLVGIAGDVILRDLNGDGILDLTAGDGTSIATYTGSGSATFTKVGSVSGVAGEIKFADFNNDGALDAFAVGGSGVSYFSGKAQSQYFASDIDISTQTKAQTLLGILDTAFENLKTEQSKISALHNRLDASASAGLLLSDSLEEARSRSQDLDIAEETAELVRQQIMQQAQVAVLAQANLQMQTVLKLLEFND